MELIRLPNGLRVALDPMPALHTAAVGVWVRVGARWEAAHENGVAHLFEHMAFKGAGPRDARQFAEAIEQVGGMINASTSYERTAYYARVTHAHAPFALQLIADVLFDPHWREEDLAKEKGVVRQEMGEAFDQPDDRVFELHQAGVFPDQPMGRPILGAEDTLAGLSVETLAQFRAAHVGADRMVLSVAGAYDRSAVLETAEARFCGLAPAPIGAPTPASPVPGRVGEARRLEQTHIVMSWPGAPAGHEDGFALRLLAEIFGGGMASRLFQDVRETRGLVYAIDSFIDGYEDVGRLGVYAACSPKDAAEVVSVTRAVLEGLAAHGPTGEELARAKAVIAGQILMGAEAPLARAEARASQVFMRDRLIPFDELAARFEAEDAGRLQALAAAALTCEPALAVVGPKTGLRALEAQGVASSGRGKAGAR